MLRPYKELRRAPRTFCLGLRRGSGFRCRHEDVNAAASFTAMSARTLRLA